jgi:hypothetical protein
MSTEYCQDLVVACLINRLVLDWTLIPLTIFMITIYNGAIANSHNYQMGNTYFIVGL